MAEIVFTERELEKVKKQSGIYKPVYKPITEDNLGEFRGILLRHIVRLIKTTFTEYCKSKNAKPEVIEREWLVFHSILKRNM